jgi:hypothetical protein
MRRCSSIRHAEVSSSIAGVAEASVVAPEYVALWGDCPCVLCAHQTGLALIGICEEGKTVFLVLSAVGEGEAA